MRLLFVVPEFDPNAGGGIATFYRHLVPAVARRGHQVTVCVANPFGSHSGPSDIPGVTLLSPDRTHFDSARQSLHTYAAIPELHGHLIAANTFDEISKQWMKSDRFYLGSERQGEK